MRNAVFAWRKAILRVAVFVSVMLFFCPPQWALAGFGITPPYVRNSSLTRNSVYEQKILLVRSDPTSALKASIIMDVPKEIESWFTIVEGNEFILPAGEDKVPMTVRVTVPEDAEFKNYLGNIRVKTSAADLQSGVNISLGAQIDVEITVIDKIIKEFRIRKIALPDLNEGHKFWWLYFPGKMNFEMMVENTGNVDVAPSDVKFRLYDYTGQILLEETSHTNRLKKIAPFKTETLYAELPTRLPRGTYKGRFEIYNEDTVVNEGELTVSIMPYGTLQTAGYGFLGLSLAHKLSVLLPVFSVLATIIVFLVRRQGRGNVTPRRSKKSDAK